MQALYVHVKSLIESTLYAVRQLFNGYQESANHGYRSPQPTDRHQLSPARINTKLDIHTSCREKCRAGSVKRVIDKLA